MKKLVLASTVLLSLVAFSKVTNAEEVAHKVQNGDTLSEIATKYNVSIDKIADKNKIENIHLIFVGQELKIDGEHQVEVVQETQVQPETQPETYVEPTNEVEVTYAAPSGNGDNWHRANRRMVESTDNYNIGSANGYIGAYQFAPGTWNSIANKYGLNPNDYSPANQDAMADAYANDRYGGWSNVPTVGGW